MLSFELFNCHLLKNKLKQAQLSSLNAQFRFYCVCLVLIWFCFDLFWLGSGFGFCHCYSVLSFVYVLASVLDLDF